MALRLLDICRETGGLFKMRIAQVSPLYESVPPKRYGGTERVVSYLTEELIRQGHEVTLFASGDSTTKARLVAPCARTLRLDAAVKEPLAHHSIQLDQVLDEVEIFDIIHFLSVTCTFHCLIGNQCRI